MQMHDLEKKMMRQTVKLCAVDVARWSLGLSSLSV
jgi:hypothetical protein